MLNKINLQRFADEDIEPAIDENVEVVEPQQEVDTESDIETEIEETEETNVDNDDVETDVNTESKTKQSKEVDSAFAKARKRAEEAEERVNKLEAQRQRDDEVKNNYSDYGVFSEADISKKYGVSHGIHTVEDLQKQILTEEYQAKGIDPNVINQMIENHPAIKEAQKIRDNSMIATQYNQLVNDLKEDGLDFVKSPSDIPTNVYDKWNYGKSGLSLSDCYYLAQRKTIESRKISATKQATLNNLNGKKHLSTQGDGNSSASNTSVPAETLQYYMDMNMSKKEALAHYKKIYG